MSLPHIVLTRANIHDVSKKTGVSVEELAFLLDHYYEKYGLLSVKIPEVDRRYRAYTREEL